MNTRIATFAAIVLLAGSALAAGKNGSVTLNCPVVGATVFIDGEEIGAIPMDPFELKFGKHMVRVVRSGLIAFQQEVMLRPGEQIVVNAFPKDPRSLLTVETGVSGAEVLVDGKVLGTTPMKDKIIDPGLHTMIIRKADLKPYREDFTAPPHREYVAKPVLLGKDGKPAGGAAGGLLADTSMDLDLDMGTPSKLPPPKSSGLDLDLDMDAPVAKAPPKKGSLDLDMDLDLGPVAKNDKKPQSASLDLDLDMPPPPGGLDLDLDMPATPAPAPAPVSKNTAAPSKLAFDDGKIPPAPPATIKPPPGKQLVPKAPTIAKKNPPKAPPKVEPPPQVASFVADPIAKEVVDEGPPGPPIYTRTWFIGGTAGAVVVTAAVMLYTSRYIETRDPVSACPDCGTNIMNQ